MKKNLIKNLAGWLIIAMISIITYSCNSVSYASAANSTRTMSIDKKFTGLKTEAAIEITYTQNNSKPMAVITGPKEVIDGMNYSINKKGVLSFVLPKTKKNYRGKVSIELNGGPLYNYEATSSGTIKVTTPVKVSETLNFAVSSSGEIVMMKDINSGTKNINVAVSSSGKMMFQGSLLEGAAFNFVTSSSAFIKFNSIEGKAMNYAASSVGTLEGLNLKLNIANFSVSSGGGITVRQLIANTLSATTSSGAEIDCENVNIGNISLIASSGGTITLNGKVNEAIMSASSGGDINVKGLKINKTINRNSSSGGSINL